MDREPVLLGLSPAIVTGLITSAVNLGNVFGAITVTPDQLNALNAFAIQLMTVLAVLGVAVARDRVTPT
ncbi:MAG: hypothetical protein KF809_17415 [Chloroflexi bacterium]|nr:hypothetical protein [Chloroflexota bacterium]